MAGSPWFLKAGSCAPPLADTTPQPPPPWAGGEGRFHTAGCPGTASQPLLCLLSLSSPDQSVCLEEDVSCSFGGWMKSLIKGTSAQIPRTLSRPQAGNMPGITIHEEVVGPRYRIQNFPVLPFPSQGNRSFIPGKEGALEVIAPPLAVDRAAAAAEAAAAVCGG